MLKTFGQSVVDLGQWVQEVVFKPTSTIMNSELRELGIDSQLLRPETQASKSFLHFTYPRC